MDGCSCFKARNITTKVSNKTTLNPQPEKSPKKIEKPLRKIGISPERNGVKVATAPKNRLKNLMTRKVYGPDAEVNAYMWDEAKRLTADGFSKYLN